VNGGLARGCFEKFLFPVNSDFAYEVSVQIDEPREERGRAQVEQRSAVGYGQLPAYGLDSIIANNHHRRPQGRPAGSIDQLAGPEDCQSAGRFLSFSAETETE
jgi:hypothetical protein